MSSFDSIDFKVKVDDNSFPPVARDEEGIGHYAATILLESRDDLEWLLDHIAIVTPKRALSTRTVTLHTDVGATYDLIVPAHAGVLKTYTAALTKCEAKGYAVWGEFYWADCEWTISSDLTP